MASLSLKHIYKVYDGDVTAVKDFNLEIEDKEFIIFVGPSGCGKSTTLRMIAGLEDITKGELSIDGKVVNDVAPKDRDIAMVFQSYALYPHMTVAENISFGLKLRKMPKDEIEKKVKDAAKTLDIEHLLDRKPKALSGGQRQRVALGRAIVREPKVFLMDEPLSNLDAKLRVQMRTEIAKLYSKLKTTFIYVTHDQTEAMTLGSRIVVMKDGVAQQIATPKEIYNNPANLFVATFIGSPQMNILYGETISRDGKIYLKVLNKEVELTKEQARKLRANGYENKEVLVGIRPENISCKKEDVESSDVVFKEKIDVSENLGAETFLHLNIDGRNVIIKTTTTDGLDALSEIEFVLDTSRIHIFDKEEQFTVI